MTLRNPQNIRRSTRRRGTSAVEVALMMPVFITLLAGMMEFSHALFVSHMLKAAAKSGARYGSAGGVTTAQVQDKVKQIVASSINASKCTVLIKDAGVFDTSGVTPSNINYSTLPPVELSTIEQGHLYIVQVTVPYSQVALLTPKWVIGRTITGQSVLRHE
ncbi:MAG: pilus assembly protein [Planctomycetes bacterium]|nr:pilus assembly protein [Planctomycetota bacterium]